jgi:dTDP-4-amino-4,6-dideoxygalactose transaminase
MLAFPQPRYRIYGASRKYLSVATDLLAGRIARGDGEASLEAAVCRYIGTRHAIAMSQARVALFCALRALIKPGAKVVLSPYTIHDVINMVICAGGNPVFADIDPATTNIDVAEIEKLVDRETGAVLITHLHGLACDVQRIADFCRSRGVPLVEDCAQAFGTRVAGRRVGSFGSAGVFSFGMAKNINAFYGGMLVTDDDGVAANVRRQIGELPMFDVGALVKRIVFCLIGEIVTSRPVFWSSAFWLLRLAYLRNIEVLNNQWRGELDPEIKRTIPSNYLQRMTSAQARLAQRQIDRVDRDTATRISYAKLYDEGLRDIDQVIRPPLLEDGSHIYLTYPIQVPDRNALNRYLMKNCQDITIQHLINTADAACFAQWARDCPNARATAGRLILLPTYPSYGERDVARNIRLLHHFFMLRG